MGTIACLSLIMYMEALNQGDYTKALVADVAIERAKQEELSVCQSMKSESHGGSGRGGPAVHVYLSQKESPHRAVDNRHNRGVPMDHGQSRL